MAGSDTKFLSPVVLHNISFSQYRRLLFKDIALLGRKPLAKLKYIFIPSPKYRFSDGTSGLFIFVDKDDLLWIENVLFIKKIAEGKFKITKEEDDDENFEGMDDERKASKIASWASYGNSYVCSKDIDKDGSNDVVIGIAETSGRFKKDKVVSELGSLLETETNVRVVLKEEYKKILRTGELEP